MKVLLPLLCIPSLLLAIPRCELGTPAHAESVPARGQVDSRTRTATYDPDEVYKLRGYIGYQIDLQFAEGEEFIGMGAGDMEGLAVDAAKNHLFLKPKQERVRTNLTILTNRRHYHFDYTVLRKELSPTGEDVIYAVRFRYPKDELQQAAAQRERGRVEDQLRTAAAARRRNFAYWYCGDTGIRPVSAFDDGVQTRIRFGDQSELPAIFVKNDDGTESLINFNLDQDEVVIHRVARQFVIRRGKLVGCVVNKAFDGSGRRLNSGTVSPDIHRQTRGEEQ